MRFQKSLPLGLLLCLIFAQALPLHAASAVSGGASREKRPQGDLDSYWKASGKRCRAGRAFHRAMRWAPGQYVVEGESIEGRHDNVTKFLLVRREKGGWVVEIETASRRGSHLYQALVSGVDEAIADEDASRLRLLWARSAAKDGGIVTTQKRLALELIGQAVRPAAARLLANIKGHRSGGAVMVPAASFADTSLNVIQTRGVFGSSENSYWYNQNVPINGLVRYNSDVGRRTIELLAFGFNGVPKMKEPANGAEGDK